MISELVVLVLFSCLVSVNVCQDVKTVNVAGVLIDPTLDQSWAIFKERFAKDYSGPTEELVRRVNWEENVSRIRTHNGRFRRGLETFQMATNRRSDWTRTEWKHILGPDDLEEDTRRQPNSTVPSRITSTLKRASSTIPSGSIPRILDLRRSPCMPPVKDQDGCGSCWAFASVAPIEYRLCRDAMRYGPPVLSEQQLVDCSWSYDNHGCNGGRVTRAWQYIRDHGITTNCTYPYVAKDQPCRYEEVQAVARVTRTSAIQPFDI